MNTRKIAEEYRLTHWAGIMRERQTSGISIREYCKTAGFSEHTYYYWQKKLREAACRELTVQTEDGGNKSIVPSGWSVCEAAADKSESGVMRVEIGSFKISVDEYFDPQLLTKVCKALIPLISAEGTC
jgi:transposase-like protein